MSGFWSARGRGCSEASACSKLVKAWVTGTLQVSQDFGGHNSVRQRHCTYDPGT